MTCPQCGSNDVGNSMIGSEHATVCNDCGYWNDSAVFKELGS